MKKQFRILVGLLLVILVVVLAFLYHKKYRSNPLSTEIAATPDVGCVWAPFKSSALGLSMSVEQCSPVRETFSVVGNTIQIKDVYDQVDTVIEVFSKPAGQSIEDALRSQFIDKLPGSFSKTCIVNKANVDPNSDPANEYFDIEPNATRKAVLDKEADGDIPDYSECGPYALDTDSNSYFEYEPNNANTKFILVNAGQDTTPFSTNSIKLVN